MEGETQRDLQVGDRISVSGSIATIRFKGPLLGTSVPKKEEQWLGVEWDDAKRGKNNGAVKGANGEAIQFFEVKNNNGGSFLRLSSLAPPVVVKTHLLDALFERYDPKSNSEAVKKFVSPPPPSPHLKYDEKFEYCVKDGEEGGDIVKDGHGGWVDLGDCGICEINDPAILSQSSLSTVHNIDLTRNLLSKWTDILPLFYFNNNDNNDNNNNNNNNPLPALRTLNLRYNRLASSSSLLSLSPSPSPTPLRILILNYNEIEKEDVENLGKSRIFENIEELHLAFNQLSGEKQDNLGVTPAFFPSLKVLDLTSNSLSSWSSLLSLSQFSTLETLYLGSNSLPDLPSSLMEEKDGFEFDEHFGLKNKKDFFPELKTLSLDQNNLTCLFSLQYLSLFPSLTSLRVGNQTGPAPETRWLGLRSKAPLAIRQLCIALLPAITTLNGSEVEKEEKEEAQKYFLKWFSGALYASSPSSSSSSSPEDFTFPPTLDSLSTSLPHLSPFLLSRVLAITNSLISVHGPPPPPTADPSSLLSSSLISLSVHLQLDSAFITRSLSLPPTTTFTDILGFVEGMIKEELGEGEEKKDGEMSLFIQRKEEDGGKGGMGGLVEKVEEVGGSLDYHVVKNGDVIIVRPSLFD